MKKNLVLNSQRHENRLVRELGVCLQLEEWFTSVVEVHDFEQEQ